MFKRITLILIPLVFGPVGFAQYFQKANQQEFDSFADKANREYAEFMRKCWEWFEGKEPVSPPVKQEPVVPPVVVPEEDLERDRKRRRFLSVFRD